MCEARADRFSTLPGVSCIPCKNGGQPPFSFVESKARGRQAELLRPIFGHTPRKFPCPVSVNRQATSHIYAHQAFRLYHKPQVIAREIQNFAGGLRAEFQRFCAPSFMQFAQCRVTAFRAHRSRIPPAQSGTAAVSDEKRKKSFSIAISDTIYSQIRGIIYG